MPPGQILNNNKCETEVFDWKIQLCPPCGDSVTLSASCQNQFGKTVKDGNCTNPKPTDRQCPKLDPCTYLPLPDNMLGMYYFIGNCPQQARNIPDGLLDVANTIFVSFVIGPFNNLSCGLLEACETIKLLNPNIPVLLSVGGLTGSASDELYTYLNDTDEDTIVQHIKSWPHVDGIDWDLEIQSLLPDPKWGCACHTQTSTEGGGKRFFTEAMSTKIASISTKVKQNGMHVTMAGVGS